MRLFTSSCFLAAVLASAVMVNAASVDEHAKPVAGEGAKVVRTIYFDKAHGRVRPPSKGLQQIAAKHGGEFKVHDQEITSEALASVDLLYLHGPKQGFARSEERAIIDYVQRGGSLIIVMDEERRTPLKKTGVNRILKPFSLAFTKDTPYLHNCGGVAKAGLLHKEALEVPFSGGRATVGGTPFAFQLDREGKPAEPFAAYQTTKSGGKIVIFGEGMAALLLGTEQGERLTGASRNVARTTYWGKDSVPFMSGVLAWLLEKEVS